MTDAGDQAKEPFDYTHLDFEVRSDLALAHRRAWQHIAAAGTWWTGAERVAIAAETRHALDCALCSERKAALSPYGISGNHASPYTLPRSAVDAVHRLITDPARLSRKWVDEITDREPSTEHTDAIATEQYIELIGVVTQVYSIDEFHRALGLPVEDLPSPLPGEPSRQRPAGAAMEEAWVPMILPQNLAGDTEGLYGSGKRTGNVIRAMSLVPEEVRQLQRLSAAQYLAVEQMMHFDQDFRSISRGQIELVAGRVSALNECFY